MATNCTVQARHRTFEDSTPERTVVQAELIDEYRERALRQRRWADTGEHGYSHKPRLHSFCGWWVLPGMVMEAKFSKRVADLGLGNVRVIGMPQQIGQYTSAPWAMLVESIETGERGVFINSGYDVHDCHVTAPSYMTSRDAFHAVTNLALSYAHERFDLD